MTGVLARVGGRGKVTIGIHPARNYNCAYQPFPAQHVHRSNDKRVCTCGCACNGRGNVTIGIHPERSYKFHMLIFSSAARAGGKWSHNRYPPENAMISVLARLSLEGARSK